MWSIMNDQWGHWWAVFNLRSHFDGFTGQRKLMCDSMIYISSIRDIRMPSATPSFYGGGGDLVGAWNARGFEMEVV